MCPQKTDDDEDDDCSLQGGFVWEDGSAPFSDDSCRRAETFHGLAPGSVTATSVFPSAFASPFELP